MPRSTIANIAGLLALCLSAFASPAHAQMPACPNPFVSGVNCIPITASSTGTTAATTATLPAVVGKTSFICSFQITSNATAGLSVPATVTGTIGGTLNYNEPVGVTPAVGQLIVAFNPCVPATGTNAPIAVNAGAAGAAGVTAVTATGYQL